MFTAFWALVTMSSFAQKQSQTSLMGKKIGYIETERDKKDDTQTKSQELNLTSGDYLQLAGNDFIKSGCFILSGSALGVGGSFIKGDAKWAFIGLGGVAGIFSLYYGFHGAVQLGKAGQKLKQEQKANGLVYVKPANSGIGINIAF